MGILSKVSLGGPSEKMDHYTPPEVIIHADVGAIAATATKLVSG